MPNSQLSRIAILKPCCLGDVVMATAVLAPLRAAFPRAAIDWFVGDWSRLALANHPEIRRIRPAGPVGAGEFTRAGYLSLVRRLRRGRYDLVVVLDRSLWLNLAPALALIPLRAGIDSGGRGFSLTHKTQWPPARHEADLYLDVVRALGIEVGPAQPSYHPAPKDLAAAAAQRAVLFADATRPLALIHPGGAVNPGMALTAKRWRAEGFAAIASRLLERAVDVLLVGAPSDAEPVTAVRTLIEGGMETPAGLLAESVGTLSLSELAALASQADLYLGNDSGPTHLAAAAGAPTVGVFGPTRPEIYGVRGPGARSVRAAVRCEHCRGPGLPRSTCDDARCWRELSVEQVWRAVEDMMAEGEGRPSPPAPLPLRQERGVSPSFSPSRLERERGPGGEGRP